MTEAKFTGVCEATKHPKIKVNHRMHKVLFLERVSQETFFKQKDFSDKIFIAKGDQHVYSSGDGESYSDLRCEIAEIKGDHVLDEKSIRNILSLADVMDSYRVTMDTRIDDAFFAHASEGISRCRRTSDRMHAVNGHANSVVSRSEWEDMFEKEGNAKIDEICENSLVAEKLSHLSPRERERVKISRKSSQALGTCSTNDFKAVIRMNLMRDDEVTTDEVSLAEKTFGPEISGLKGNNVRSRTFPMKNQVMDVPRELLSLYEKIEKSLDGCFANGQLLMTSISHKTCYGTAIPSDDADKKNLMKAVDNIFQVCCKCVFHVMKFHCDKQFETAVHEWRVKQYPITKANYCNAGERVPRVERKNRVVQERARTSFYQIPRNHLPRELLWARVAEAARKLNFFPARDGM